VPSPLSIEVTPDSPSVKAESKPQRLEVTFLTSFLPYPIDQGGIMATASFIEALAKCASVSVLVLTSSSYKDDEVRAAEEYYNRFCRSFVLHRFASLSPAKSRGVKALHYLSGYPRHGFWSKDAEDALIAHIQASHTQVIWCNSPFESKYLPAAKRMGCHTVVTTHNVEADLIRQQARTVSGISRWMARVRSFDVERLEKEAAKSADVVTAITESDLQHFRSLKSTEQTFLLPFGYRDANSLGTVAAGQSDQHAVCFIGTMNWAPNITAARFLVREVMPLVWKTMPDTKCFLVGKNPTEELERLKSERVTVTGSVPAIAEYYYTVPVAVVPMRQGGGIKIKLVEAMAAGCAVVSTSIGAAGLNVENGRHLIIADDAGEFAKGIVRLLSNRSERIKLGTEAQAFIRESFSPQQTENQARKILEYLRNASRLGSLGNE